MPKWRYGIVKFFDESNDYYYYSIGELYFESDPLKPFSCSENHTYPYEDFDPDGNEKEVVESIVNQLDRMRKDALKYPIFDLKNLEKSYNWGKPLSELTADQINNLSDDKIEEFLKS